MHIGMCNLTWEHFTVKFLGTIIMQTGFISFFISVKLKTNYDVAVSCLTTLTNMSLFVLHSFFW